MYKQTLNYRNAIYFAYMFIDIFQRLVIYIFAQDIDQDDNDHISLTKTYPINSAPQII